MSRETRTAQTNQTGAFERLEEFLIVGYNRWLNLFGNFLFSICGNYHNLVHITDAGGHSGNRFNGTGHTGVGPCAHKRLRGTDKLSDLDIIPLLDQWVTRCAHVHM